MKQLFFSIVIITILSISVPAFAQSYIWQETFSPAPTGWTLEANWSFTGGYMQLNWSPTIENYDLSATSPEIYIPHNAGDLHVSQWINYFSYVNEQFEIALLVGDQVHVLWTHSGTDWGFSGGQLLTIPLNDYQNTTGHLRFRSFGQSTWNLNYWRIYHVGIEGTTGSVNGYVYDQATSNPLGGTTVEILGTNFITTTNTSGYFSLTSVPTGTYDIRALLVGYDPVIIEDVLIEENQTTSLNYYLEELDFITVSGQVVGSDYPDIGLVGATVSFSGYNTYDTVTGTDGLFSIPGVYCGQTYYITVNATGYATYNGELTVGDDDLDIGSIIVNEIAFPPQSIVATLATDHSFVNVYWQPPSPTNRQGSNRILEAYIIFRFPYEELEDEGSWTELATVEENNYNDTGITALPNGTYGYAIRSLYTNNVISDPEFSNPVEYEEIFPNITNLQASQEGMDVHLSWEWLNDLVASYNSHSTGGNRDLLGFSITRNGAVIAEDVMDLSYIDAGLSPGTYTYTVIGTFTNGNTDMLFTEIELLSSEIGNLEALLSGLDVHLSWEWVAPGLSSAGISELNEPEDKRADRSFLGFTVTRNGNIITEGLMQTSLIDLFVSPGTVTYTVTGYFSDGETNSLETELDVPIPQITNLEIAIVGENDFHLTWEWLIPGREFNIASNRNCTFPGLVNRDFYGFTITRNGDTIIEGLTETEYLDENLLPDDYLYTVHGVFDAGNTNILEIEIKMTNIFEDEMPVELLATALTGNYPNPFNPETVIHYTVADQERVSIDIFDIRGSLIKTLIDEHHQPGSYSAVWNGKDESGNPAGSGVYFYRMRSGRYTSTRKMLILK